MPSMLSTVLIYTNTEYWANVFNSNYWSTRKQTGARESLCDALNQPEKL